MQSDITTSLIGDLPETIEKDKMNFDIDNQTALKQ